MRVTLNAKLRDALADALIRQAHRDIAVDVYNRFGDERLCGGISKGAGACGACRDCVYAQSTYLDLIGDGYARWQVKAAALVVDLQNQLEGADQEVTA